MEKANELLEQFKLSDDLRQILNSCPSLVIPKNKADLIELSLGGKGEDYFEVKFETPGKGSILEATIVRCKNGIAVNYPEPYMRRRDPDTLVVADNRSSDKPKFQERFSMPFQAFQIEVFEWLKKQDLILLPFYAGSQELNYQALLVGPLNAAFFSAALAELQGMIPEEEIPDSFTPRILIFLAPPFRHTHCHGKQVVIHNREENIHEIYSLNLYPGPSAKKGVYGALINLSEKEGWVTVHGSTVRITTPYDNEFVIMHEGASGSGKSEMLQYPHREPDGRLLIGENIITQRKRYIPLFQGCTLNPVTDDIALCHLPNQNDRLVIKDAEEGWFVRVNHITHYGIDSYLEGLCTNPPEPLVFLNLYAVANATCLIWEHTLDKPGHPCPNPRVILPRRIVPGIVNDPVEVNVRSFGIRTPSCTKEHPTYGIVGMLHMLPPALAWLWRLVSPRGHDNPSITETSGMSSEGVGSYWPFATGRRVDQANLLLRQILSASRTRYSLVPNQHIGSWKVGFMPQWIAREYLSRRGSAKFKPNQLEPARCPLLGHAIHSMQIEGFFINREFLQVNTQEEVGNEAYDKGARILTDFFKQEIMFYLAESDLDSTGKKIIECCMSDGKLEDYEKIIRITQ